MEGMNSQVIYEGFSHAHNPLDVAHQEYELAKQHFREVMQYRDATNPEHQKRFRDAVNQQEAARNAYLKALCD
jgi:cytoplasmic iron level regulating protein YaaA (DUF328/UPF0246 family)